MPPQLSSPPLQVERVRHAGLVHRVDSGNFYHLLSEVMPTYFANWCRFLGYCRHAQRKAFALIFIQPDPKREFVMVLPVKNGFQCLSGPPLRDARDERGPVLVGAGVVGIGPYLRAYEKQEFRAQWEDPAPGLMPEVRGAGAGTVPAYCVCLPLSLAWAHLLVDGWFCARAKPSWLTSSHRLARSGGASCRSARAPGLWTRACPRTASASPLSTAPGPAAACSSTSPRS